MSSDTHGVIKIEGESVDDFNGPRRIIQIDGSSAEDFNGPRSSEKVDVNDAHTFNGPRRPILYWYKYLPMLNYSGPEYYWYSARYEGMTLELLFNDHEEKLFKRYAQEKNVELVEVDKYDMDKNTKRLLAISAPEYYAMMEKHNYQMFGMQIPRPENPLLIWPGRKELFQYFGNR